MPYGKKTRLGKKERVGKKEMVGKKGIKTKKHLSDRYTAEFDRRENDCPSDTTRRLIDIDKEMTKVRLEHGPSDPRLRTLWAEYRKVALQSEDTEWEKKRAYLETPTTSDAHRKAIAEYTRLVKGPYAEVYKILTSPDSTDREESLSRARSMFKNDIDKYVSLLETSLREKRKAQGGIGPSFERNGVSSGVVQRAIASVSAKRIATGKKIPDHDMYYVPVSGMMTVDEQKAIIGGLFPKEFMDFMEDGHIHMSDVSGARTIKSISDGPHVELYDGKQGIDLSSTTAHEFGHAYQYYLLKKEDAHPAWYIVPPVLAEAAAFWKEQAFYDKMPAETRKALYRKALLRQKLNAALYGFENELSDSVAAGETLTPEVVNATWVSYRNRAFPEIDWADGSEVDWARVQHVYKYHFYNYPYVVAWDIAAEHKGKDMERVVRAGGRHKYVATSLRHART